MATPMARSHQQPNAPILHSSTEEGPPHRAFDSDESQRHVTVRCMNGALYSAYQASCQSDQHNYDQGFYDAPTRTTHLVESKSNHVGEENNRKVNRVEPRQWPKPPIAIRPESDAELSTLELLDKNASKQKEQMPRGKQARARRRRSLSTRLRRQAIPRDMPQKAKKPERQNWR